MNDATCALGGDQKHPGLYLGERNSYPRYYTTQNVASVRQFPQFRPESWTGIDCSGLVQRAVDNSRNVALGLQITIPTPVPRLPQTVVNAQGFFTDNTRVFNVPLPAADSQENIEERNSLLAKLRKGNLMRYLDDGHISIVHSERPAFTGTSCNYRIVHAYGEDRADLNNDGVASEFARKALVSPDRMLLPNGVVSLASSTGFGRIKLWGTE